MLLTAEPRLQICPTPTATAGEGNRLRIAEPPQQKRRLCRRPLPQGVAFGGTRKERRALEESQWKIVYNCLIFIYYRPVPNLSEYKYSIISAYIKKSRRKNYVFLSERQPVRRKKAAPARLQPFVFRPTTNPYALNAFCNLAVICDFIVRSVDSTIFLMASGVDLP